MTADVTLHTRLVEYLDEYVGFVENGERLGPGYHALRTVVDLHKPVPCRDLYPCSLRHEHITCRRCKGPWFPELKHWPCSTIQAIADQLGLTEGTDRG